MDNKITVCGIERVIRPLNMREMDKAVRQASKEKFAQEVDYTLATWINISKVCARPALKTDEIFSLGLEDMDKLIQTIRDVTLSRYPLLTPLFKAIELKCSEHPRLVKLAAQSVSKEV